MSMCFKSSKTDQTSIITGRAYMQHTAALMACLFPVGIGEIDPLQNRITLSD